MPQTNCPDLAALQQYVIGKLRSSRRKEVESHLMGCPECAMSADALSPEDEIAIAFATSSLRDVEAANTKLIELMELAHQITAEKRTVR